MPEDQIRGGLGERPIPRRAMSDDKRAQHDARSVVVTAGQYPDLVVADLVNESMLPINAPGPTTLQFVFNGSGLPRPAKGSLCTSRTTRMMRRA